MKRIIRSVFVSLSAITLILTLSAPIISSNMQGYYKELISEMPENTQVLLEKKACLGNFRWNQAFYNNIFNLSFLFFNFRADYMDQKKIIAIAVKCDKTRWLQKTIY